LINAESGQPLPGPLRYVLTDADVGQTT
jgi:hypothetical protein